MRKQKNFILSLIIISSLGFPFVCFSQEERLKITTYFPSPYANFYEARPQRLAIGSSYYDISQYCWSGVCTNTIDANADLIVGGKMGIGTYAPSALLDIKSAFSAWPYTAIVLKNTDSTGQYSPAIYTTNALTQEQGRIYAQGGTIYFDGSSDAGASWFHLASFGAGLACLTGPVSVRADASSPLQANEMLTLYSALALREQDDAPMLAPTMSADYGAFFVYNAETPWGGLTNHALYYRDDGIRNDPSGDEHMYQFLRSKTFVFQQTYTFSSAEGSITGVDQFKFDVGANETWQFEIVCNLRLNHNDGLRVGLGPPGSPGGWILSAFAIIRYVEYSSPNPPAIPQLTNDYKAAYLNAISFSDLLNYDNNDSSYVNLDIRGTVIGGPTGSGFYLWLGPLKHTAAYSILPGSYFIARKIS